MKKPQDYFFECAFSQKNLHPLAIKLHLNFENKQTCKKQYTGKTKDKENETKKRHPVVSGLIQSFIL